MLGLNKEKRDMTKETTLKEMVGQEQLDLMNHLGKIEPETLTPENAKSVILKMQSLDISK